MDYAKLAERLLPGDYFPPDHYEKIYPPRALP